MENKDREFHPERYEVTVFDTMTEKIVLEKQTYGTLVGVIDSIGVMEDGELQQYLTTRPLAINFGPQDAATLVFALLEMFPEAKYMLDHAEFGLVDIEEGEEEEDD